MQNSRVEQALYVSTDGNAGPYIIVPADRLKRVEELLKEGSVPHWTDADVVSIDDKPALGIINLSEGVDVGRVNELLKQL